MYSRFAVAYRANLAKELRRYGLMAEDTLIETEEVKLALSRLPKQVIEARELRLKRALMLDMMGKELPEEVSLKYDPFDRYLKPYLDQVEQDKKEMLGK